MYLDARARTVKFVFDMRSHPTGKLFHPSLAMFQGPALIAYNSALFEEKDFESIRRLGASRKIDDLTKVRAERVFPTVLNSIHFIRKTA